MKKGSGVAIIYLYKYPDKSLHILKIDKVYWKEDTRGVKVACVVNIKLLFLWTDYITVW